MKKYRCVLATVLLLGCSTVSLDLDSGEGRVVIPCVPGQTGTDIENCGTCGHSCSTSNADGCIDGRCVCGMNEDCGDGADCRFGICIPVDLAGRSCEFDPECVAGHVCVEGSCSFVNCVVEACDGVDNDCDGFIDNFGTSPLSQYCLGHALSEDTGVLPPCQRGVRICVNGLWGECVGSVVPQEEQGLLACDGVDNDCDGCIDGAFTLEGICEAQENLIFDVAFLIDVSASMTEEIELVKRTTQLFSSRLTSSAFLWALLEIPGPENARGNVLTDFTDLTTFQGWLDSIVRTHGGREPQWDTVYEITTGEIPLSWRPGAVRIIVLFTDEIGQSTRLSLGESPVDEGIMCSVLTHGEVFIAVTTLLVQGDFDDCSIGFVLPPGYAGSGESCSVDLDCGREICFEGICTTDHVITLVSQLESVLGDPCGG